MKLDEVLLHLKVDGWCVVDGVIPSDDVTAVRESILATAVRMTAQETRGVDAAKGLIASDQSLAPYLSHERVYGVAEALFGSHVRISFTTAIVNQPGNARGGWHSDWPFNQTNAGHVPAPYPDAVMHMTSIWMLSAFSPETGGTLVVPGSHRSNNNPTGANGIDPTAPYPTEMQATGEPGSVLLFDSRLWHATANNRSDKPRVGVAVRYAPWWLSLDVLMPGSDERARMSEEPGMKENPVPAVPRDVYDGLPNDVRPLFQHWVRD